MDTFMANLKHAIQNRESVTIGGGVFSATELQPVAAALSSAQRRETALKEISEMLATLPEAEVGNSKVHYCLCQARNALRPER